MNNKTLGIILLALLILFGVSQFMGNNKNRSFDPNVLSLVPEDVDRIEFTNATQGTVTATKNGEEWEVSDGTKTYKGDKFAIEAAIGELKSVIAKKVAARSKEKAVDFDTDDEKSTRIKAYQSNKMLADVNIGRFSFDQQSRQPISYIRKNSEKETYLVQSFLAMSTKKDINSIRDKSFISVSNSSISGLQLLSPNGNFILENLNGSWFTSDQIAIDSSGMSKYLENLQDLKGNTFHIGSTENTEPEYALDIKLTDGSSITSYAVKLDDENFAVHSSQNSENVFESNNSGIVKKIFIDLIDLLPTESD